MRLVTSVVALAMAVGMLLAGSKPVSASVTRKVDRIFERATLAKGSYPPGKVQRVDENLPRFLAAPVGSYLIAPPALAAGQPAWVSVRSALGQRLGGVAVLVNGIARGTDSAGLVTFQVPKAENVTIEILDSEKRPVSRKRYFTAGGALLVSETPGKEVYTALN